MEGFTVALALMDGVPVAFFAAAMVLTALRFGSALFAAGAAVITLASCCKVLWKLILGIWKKNVAWLNRLFIPAQLSGLVLVLLSAAMDLRGIAWKALCTALTGFPSAVFFLCWLAGMGLMGWYRKNKFDNSARANWTAQLVNTAAQGALLLGVLFA